MYLDIQFCSSLTFLLSENDLPATIEHLELRFCPKLSFSPLTGYLPKAFKYLCVHQYSNLESIAQSMDKTSLQRFMISYCENLKFLPNGLDKLPDLQGIGIGYCQNLVSFPE